MVLHAFYVLAGREQAMAAKRVPVTGARLRLPNGEVKVPHGGLTLLCQVDSRHEGLSVHGRRVNTVGRALLRGSPRTRAGCFSLGVKDPCFPGDEAYAI